MYAQWSAGSTTYSNTTVTLRSNSFTRTGYTFAGWNSQANGSGTSYSSSYTGQSDITLYAQWTPINYTLTINPNGGSYNSSTSNTTATVAYQGTYSFVQGPTRSNYLFSHWTSNNLADFYTSGNYDVYNNNGNGAVTKS